MKGNTVLELIAGLLIFLGVHSIRVRGDSVRDALVTRLGPLGFKLAYSSISLVGLLLIVWGYAAARLEPIVVWQPPMGMAHASSLLTLVAFVFLAAAYIPGNFILRKTKQPMTIAVKLWAFGHLLANGGLHDIILFSGFLIWAVLVFRSARRRTAPANPSLVEQLPAWIASKPANRLSTLLTLGAGIGAWAWFAFVGHALLIGVAPFAR